MKDLLEKGFSKLKEDLYLQTERTYPISGKTNYQTQTHLATIFNYKRKKTAIIKTGENKSFIEGLPCSAHLVLDMNSLI